MADKADPRPAADEIARAYWPRALAAADAARARAQSGFTVASAIATGLVAAGLFTNLADRSHPARYVGAIALMFWLAAMLLFLFAVASPTPPRTADPVGPTSRAEFVVGLLEPVERERRQVEWRQRLAVSVTGAAVILTAASFTIGTIWLAVDRDRGTLVLTAKGSSALEHVCKPKPLRLHGELDVPTLKADFVVFRIDKGACRATKRSPVRIPRADVIAFLEDSGS
jgi:hypothetical protein